jgi:hypothetical protein
MPKGRALYDDDDLDDGYDDDEYLPAYAKKKIPSKPVTQKGLGQQAKKASESNAKGKSQAISNKPSANVIIEKKTIVSAHSTTSSAPASGQADTANFEAALNHSGSGHDASIEKFDSLNLGNDVGKTISIVESKKKDLGDNVLVDISDDELCESDYGQQVPSMTIVVAGHVRGMLSTSGLSHFSYSDHAGGCRKKHIDWKSPLQDRQCAAKAHAPIREGVQSRWKGFLPICMGDG